MPMSADSVYWYATWRGENANSPLREGRLAVTGTETRRALRDDRADWHPCVAALVDVAADVHVVETAQLVRPLPRLAVAGSRCSATPPTR